MATAAYEEKIDIGRVLERGFGVIRRNAGPFLGAGLVFAGLPNFAIQYLSADPAFLPETMTGTVIVIYLGVFLFLVFGSFLLQAAIVRAAVLDLSGRPASLGASLQAAVSLVLPMLGLAIVAGFGILFGLLLLIVPGIMLYVMWSVAGPVLIQERTGVFDSLSRSAALTSGSRWRVFGLLIIVALLSGVINAVFAVLPVDPLNDPLLFAAIFTVSAVLGAVLGAAMTASLYVELRTVKEGAPVDGLATIFE